MNKKINLTRQQIGFNEKAENPYNGIRPHRLHQNW